MEQVSIDLSGCQLTYESLNPTRHEELAIASLDCEALLGVFGMPSVADFLVDDAPCTRVVFDFRESYSSEYLGAPAIVKDVTGCSHKAYLRVDEALRTLLDLYIRTSAR